MPLMVTPAAASLLLMMLSPATGLVIAIVGAPVASVNTTGVLAPVLPAASVSLATMLWVPLPDSITVVDQVLPLPTVGVPICVVMPFTVSYSVTVAPTAASVTVTGPEIVCVACLVAVPAVPIATAAGTGASA